MEVGHPDHLLKVREELRLLLFEECQRSYRELKQVEAAWPCPEIEPMRAQQQECFKWCWYEAKVWHTAEYE